MIYLNKENKIPYYIQIYKQIRQAILEEKLENGTVLMGSRTLAKELGVGRSTVDNAYAQLVAEGYIESKRGVGYVVQEIEQIEGAHSKELVRKQEEASISQTNKQSDIQLNDKLISTQIYKGSQAIEVEIKYDLSYGNYSSDFFTSKLWKRYINEAFASERIQEINHYQEKKGSVYLREQLKGYLQRARGVNAKCDQIIITGGLQHALEIICKLIASDKKIAIENPGYDGAYEVFKNNDRHVETIPLDDNGIDIEKLKEINGIRAVYITPSHQFPTGITMPIGRRYELLRWADRNQAYIIEDDFDSEYRYHTSPIPSLQSIDQKGRVIYLGTFSKALSPSLRIAYMVLPPSLLEVYHNKFSKYQCVVSWLPQYLAARMLEEGQYERHVRKMCTEFRKRHDLLVREMKKLGEGIKVVHSDAGLYFILEFPKEKKSDWLISQAEKQKVRVYDARRFYMGNMKQEENRLFIGFSLIEIDEIPDCIARLKQAWLN